MVVETEIPNRKKRLGKIERAILGTVGLSGMLVVGAVAPGALRILGYVMKVVDARKKQSTERAFQRLINMGELVFEKKKGKTYVYLSQRGRIHYEALRLQQQSFVEDIKKTKKRISWDGRWRIVAFDIREYRRTVRDQIRRELQSFGLVLLQRSIWVFPYDCSELITLLKADYKIGKEVLYIRADQIEQDAWLRKHFQLSDMEGKDIS